MMYLNDQFFEASEFDEKSIVDQSKVISLQVNENTPVWIDFQL